MARQKPTATTSGAGPPGSKEEEIILPAPSPRRKRGSGDEDRWQDWQEDEVKSRQMMERPETEAILQKRESWTFETLIVYVTSLINGVEVRASDRFIAQEKAVSTAMLAAEKATNAALAAQEKAVSLAEANAERWRASANEWRGAMDDRESKFVMVGEHKMLAAQVDELKRAYAAQVGASGGRDSLWKILLAVVASAGVIVGVIVAFLPN